MSFADLFYIMPLLIVAFASVLLLLIISFYRNNLLIFLLSCLALLIAFVSAVTMPVSQAQAISDLLIVDAFGILFVCLILLTSLSVAVLSYYYFRGKAIRKEEFYVLLLLATLGSLTVALSSHFVSFFLGLEILSVSLYGMIAYTREKEMSVEAGLKYLILAAASSAFLVFGMGLLYSVTGQMEWHSILSQLALSNESRWLASAGMALMIIGIGFKLAIVPFHMWTPDVYQGAPAPVTAFIATVSKSSILAVLLRFFVPVNQLPALFSIFSVLAIASILAGNILALMQTNVKRILAYSSIAHLGYILVAFLASGSMAIEAAIFYMVAYVITSLGTFGLVSLLSLQERDADEMDDYKGLYWRHPWYALVFTAMLFSLTGIPLTAGFVGKFYILAAGVHSMQWLLVIVLILGSAIGVYYYLRLVVVMYTEGKESAAVRLPIAGALLMGILLLLLVWLGVQPGRLLEVISEAAKIL